MRASSMKASQRPEGERRAALVVEPAVGEGLGRVAEDERDALGSAEVGEPIPVEDAFGGNDEIIPIGLDGFEEPGPVAGKVLVKQDVALGVENAQIEGTGMKVDPAVMLMLLGIEAHGSPPGLDVRSLSTFCLPTSR